MIILLLDMLIHSPKAHSFVHMVWLNLLMVLENNTWIWHKHWLLTSMVLLPRVHFTWRYYIICWVVEITTWHIFLGWTSCWCSLIFIASMFQLHLHHLTFIGECPHLFYWEYINLIGGGYWDLWEACGLLGGPLMLILYALLYSSHCICSILFKGVVVQTLLMIYGGIYFMIY